MHIKRGQSRALCLYTMEVYENIFISKFGASCVGIYIIGGLAEVCFGQLNEVVLCRFSCKLG